MRSSPLCLPLLLAACAPDAITLRPPEGPPPDAVACTVEVRRESLRCGGPADAGGSLAIIGGQNVNLKITSGNVRYDAARRTFSADITVQNLLPEAMGTGDWVTLTGVRIFFHSGPTVTAGEGEASVANPDGHGVFTASSQPYFEYDEALPPNAVSATRRWEWTVDPSVSSFAFTLYLDADRDGDDPGSGRYATISTGGSHACARTPAGEAYCWGGNNYGQIGSGDFDGHPVPAAVARGGWRSVVAGQQGTCGTAPDGAPFCWGTFTVAGSLEDEGRDCERGYACRPERVRGGHRFHVVTVGVHHTCGLTAAGEAWCWGVAARGALGSSVAVDTCDIGGPTRCAVLPVPVDGGHRFNDLTGGERHTCGLEKGGIAHCWGANSFGQRGDGTNDTTLAPTPVAGGQRFSQIDSYGSTTCGLTPPGEAWCWGDNWHGQLGNGTTGVHRNVPVKVQQGAVRFHRLAVGDEHVCALAHTGEAWCWGGNTFGQLGDGTGGDFNLSNVPVAVAGGLRFRDLDAGHFLACGVTREEGEAWCWGRSLTGEGTEGVSGTHRCHWEPCALEPVRVRPPQG